MTEHPAAGNLPAVPEENHDELGPALARMAEACTDVANAFRNAVRAPGEPLRTRSERVR